MNAYQLKCLPAMGINIRDLGCIMLDVKPLDIKGAIPADWAYHSKNPNLPHVSGIQTEAHVTLLFGLLENANLIRSAVDEVLDGWEPGRISTQTIEAFQSPIPDEPYACIIAKLQVTRQLKDAHARLSLLPHIDTHPQYLPHVTIAYVHKDRCSEAIAAVRHALGTRDIFTHADLVPIGLNYGDVVLTKGTAE